jgi:2,4-dienoyl-CoA reductase-like NADH-dependent reductase (Old Yellow Enzyme family)
VNNPVPTPQPPFDLLFEPTSLGPMELQSRVMSPPHFSAIGNLWGSEKDAERTLAYWDRRMDSALGLIVMTGRIAHHLIPGFEPTGMSADPVGFFRLPVWMERAKAFRAAAHARGVKLACQMTMIGNHPFAASRRLSSPVFNTPPHVMTRADIARTVAEYRWSARQAREAGLDGIEVHANHDDMLQYFLSPLTNARDDEYGGSLENRCRFLIEMLQAMRAETGPDMAIGVRLNMAEHVPEGYDLQGGVAIARYLQQSGLVDFIHAVMGTPWGNPSYVQPHFFAPGQWAEMAGVFRQELDLPIIHSGLIKDPAVAARILAAGQADVVGIARGFIADPDILAKAREGRTDTIRPCIGCNECISRRYTENLPFGCPVNPHAAQEIDGPWPLAKTRKSLLVIGGGPAGMELAGLARESGHEVELWEASGSLGGQLSIAARAPEHGRYEDYLAWQRARIARAGVKVRLNHRGTVDNVLAAGADVVAVATGALGRRPDEIVGAQNPAVLEASDVLMERVMPGKRVLVVAMDDGMPPLALADFLAQRGHAVTLVYGTAGPAQNVGRYIIGAPLGRLDAQGVQFRFMEQVMRIEPDCVTVRHSYSLVERRITDFDSVVLSCGGVAQSGLYDALSGRVANLHLLGDAYAPRKLAFATRQAMALAKILNA